MENTNRNKPIHRKVWGVLLRLQFPDGGIHIGEFGGYFKGNECHELNAAMQEAYELKERLQKAHDSAMFLKEYNIDGGEDGDTEGKLNAITDLLLHMQNIVNAGSKWVGEIVTEIAIGEFDATLELKDVYKIARVKTTKKQMKDAGMDIGKDFLRAMDTNNPEHLELLQRIANGELGEVTGLEDFKAKMDADMQDAEKIVRDAIKRAANGSSK